MNDKTIKVDNSDRSITFKIDKIRMQSMLRRLAIGLFVLILGWVGVTAFQSGNPLFFTLLKVSSILVLVAALAFNNGVKRN